MPSTEHHQPALDPDQAATLRALQQAPAWSGRDLDHGMDPAPAWQARLGEEAS
jgi:hypothetical protein